MIQLLSGAVPKSAHCERLRLQAAEDKQRLDEAERLTREAVEGRKRARVFSILAGAVAVVAVGLGVLAFFKQQEAVAALLEVKKKEDLRKAAEEAKELIFMRQQVQYTENFLLAGECALARQSLDTLLRLLPRHREFEGDVQRMEVDWGEGCNKQ